MLVHTSTTAPGGPTARSSMGELPGRRPELSILSRATLRERQDGRRGELRAVRPRVRARDAQDQRRLCVAVKHGMKR